MLDVAGCGAVVLHWGCDHCEGFLSSRFTHDARSQEHKNLALSLTLNIYWSFLALFTHSHSKGTQKVEGTEVSYICRTIFQKWNFLLACFFTACVLSLWPLQACLHVSCFFVVFGFMAAQGCLSVCLSVCLSIQQNQASALFFFFKICWGGGGFNVVRDVTD